MSDHTDLPGEAAVATPPWLYSHAAPLQSAVGGVGQDHIGPATTLWPTGQRGDAAQRTDRYVPQTGSHPQRTHPALVAEAITRYSKPGQTVFDPFMGAGTTLAEAVYAGRRALGVDADPRWVELSVLNLAHAHRNGGLGEELVMLGDARHLAPVPRRRVDLVVTSPPAQLCPLLGVTRRQPVNNGELISQLDMDLKLAVASWVPLLRPDATIMVATRLLHRAGQTLDLTVPVAAAAQWVGLDFVERVAALRTPVRETLTRTRPRPQRCGRPSAQRPQVVNDDVLVYRVPLVLPLWWRGRR